MKKIIFLVLVLKSFVFSQTCQNDFQASKDLLTLYTTHSYNYVGDEPRDIYFCADSTIDKVSLNYSCSPVNGSWKCYKKTFSFSNNYQCPSGQEVINGACAVPPTCTPPQIWNSDTDTCVAPPAPDADGDGTPDKCDFDHPDFKILDCDGDGKMNSGDPDMDGDGTTDTSDSDMNNDGVPDAQQPSSPTYNSNCQGADLSRDYVRNGVNYPETQYFLKGNFFPSVCIGFVNTENIDSSFTAYDKNPQCNATYCYVHILKPDCNDESSKYIPQGSEWIYKAGVSSASQCASMVDNVKYNQSTFEAPNLTNCPDSKYCFLKRVTNVPDINNSISKNIDTNRTSSDLQPLLEAHNASNQHLTDIKTKIDTTNTKLDDLKGVSNEILNKNESMDTSLKSLKSNSDKALKNDLEALSALSNISKDTQKGNDINKAFSDTATQNQVIGNGHLSDISSKMSTNNSLLTNIDSTATESKDFLSSMKNFLDGKNSDGSAPDNSSLTSSFSGVDSFINDVQSGFNNIGSSYDDLTSNINQGFSYSIPAGGSVLTSFHVFGQTVTIDPTLALVTISPVIYYITYISFFILALRIIYLAFKVV